MFHKSPNNSSTNNLKNKTDTPKFTILTSSQTPSGEQHHATSTSSNQPKQPHQQETSFAMQAYHQSFNPQAYNNGAAAVVAAAYYNQHHNPGNYVIPSQYSMPEGFSYNNTSTGIAGNSSGNPSYSSQQGNPALDAYAAAYYPHHSLSGASNLPGINTNLYSSHGSQGGYTSASGMSSSGLNVSNSPDLLSSSSYPYANSFLNAVHHLHQQTLPGSPTHTTTTTNNTENNNSNGNEPSSSSSSSLSSTNSLMPVNSSTPNLAQSSVAVAAAAAAAAFFFSIINRGINDSEEISKYSLKKNQADIKIVFRKNKSYKAFSDRYIDLDMSENYQYFLYSTYQGRPKLSIISQILVFSNFQFY